MLSDACCGVARNWSLKPLQMCRRFDCRFTLMYLIPHGMSLKHCKNELLKLNAGEKIAEGVHAMGLDVPLR